MDPAAVVAPRTWREPLGCSRSAAVMLAPRRVGDPASARALARPYRDVAARLTQLAASAGQLRRDDGRRSTSTSTPPPASPSAASSVRCDISAPRRTAPRTARSSPTRAIHPEQAGELADRMAEMDLNPAPILLVHHGAARAPRPRARGARGRAGPALLSTAPGSGSGIWADPGPELPRRASTPAPTARALIADGHHRYAAYLRLQEEHPAAPTDAGPGDAGRPGRHPPLPRRRSTGSCRTVRLDELVEATPCGRGRGDRAIATAGTRRPRQHAPRR